MAKRGIALFVVLSLFASCSQSSSVDSEIGKRYNGSVVKVGGLSVPASVQGEQLALGFGDHFEPRFWPGVNLGSTTPGHSPGELSPTADDYKRWFAEMHDLGVTVIRIYTVQRPHFYEELKSFNERHRSRPLYVLHGVWIPEEEFLATGNAYDATVTDGFKREITNAVGAAHGDISIPPQRGHASGEYVASIAPWLLGWSIGVEWDPSATVSTNAKNAGVAPYVGQYFVASPNANPMESWIASMLDHLASLEAQRGWSRPLTFTNWVTTDPLKHPDEPLPAEDVVSLDATHLSATAAWPAGFFASYHVYPYYPDLLRLQPSYASYKRADGVVDPYAGYLHELKQHHRGQPVMVTEFGMPTSIGLAHNGPLGRHQGSHSEVDAAKHLHQMMDDIQNEGLVGGIVFEWADEWFKFTWNTVEYELPPDRRQYWRNPLTNEEHFGLVAVEPERKDLVVLDGSSDEWKKNKSHALLERGTNATEVRASHDAEFLYLLIKTNKPGDLLGSTIAFDVRPGSNGGVKGHPGVASDADVQVHFDASGRIVLSQAAWTDLFGWQYGFARKYVDFDLAALQQGSGVWVPLRQVQNRPITVPSTGQQIPVETSSIDELRQGTTDPSDPAFDDRNLAYSKGTITELAIPWSFLTFSDPSSHQVYSPQADGKVHHETVGDATISLVAQNGAVVFSSAYGWSNWDEVAWHERNKAGWPELRIMYAQAAART